MGSEAIIDINDSLGGLFAIGGLFNSQEQAYAFGRSQFQSENSVTLILETD